MVAGSQCGGLCLGRGAAGGGAPPGSFPDFPPRVLGCSCEGGSPRAGRGPPCAGGPKGAALRPLPSPLAASDWAQRRENPPAGSVSSEPLFMAYTRLEAKSRASRREESRRES